MTTLVAQNFDSFVFASNDDIKTTSLLVAEKFGKSHTHVLRDIEKIMTQVSDIFVKTNFGLTEYEQQNNLGLMTKYKMYELTKDGFIMVVMSYTGAKAFAIKEAYINAFNFMMAKLKPVSNALRDLPPAQPKALTPAMLRHITKRVVWIVNHTAGVSFGSIGGAILDEFNVNERKAIRLNPFGTGKCFKQGGLKWRKCGAKS